MPEHKNKKYILLNSLGSKQSPLMKFGQFNVVLHVILFWSFEYQGRTYTFFQSATK